MASVNSRLQSQGVSEHARRLIEASHRPSTQSVYASHWRIWFSWCLRHQVNPTSPSEIDIVNHLAQLATTLSPSALRVRRSAILTTLRQLCCTVPSTSTLVNHLIKGAAALRVRVPRHIPRWDIFLVLAFLRESARFEPLSQASLRDLTAKTFFLVTLATARRVSEVHALSGLMSDVSFLPDGSVHLVFLPEFLAKNQGAGDPSPVIRIPALGHLVCADDPDRLNCPVRALKTYRAKTQRSRSQGQRRLFLSVNQDYKQDLRKPAMARWVANLVKDAYKWADQHDSGSHLPLLNPRPHELRAWSASLALAVGSSMPSILRAAYWRREDIFINCYLRDGARALSDGTKGVSTVVAAQQVLRTWNP